MKTLLVVLLLPVFALGETPREVVMEAWEAVSQNYVEVSPRC